MSDGIEVRVRALMFLCPVCRGRKSVAVVLPDGTEEIHPCGTCWQIGYVSKETADRYVGYAVINLDDPPRTATGEGDKR